jgi:tRNA modification GTPase
MSDTIFALATAPGRAGVAVLRLSGPEALATGLALTCASRPPVPRRCVRAAFRDPVTGALLDDGLWVYFPAPHSFTGEDVVELHLHGSKAVMAALTRVLLQHSGLRLAEAGEFTRRAFLSGRMDLTQADGLADLLEAETEVQRQQAVRQVQGELAKLYDHWRTLLITQLAMLEAWLDFPEEDLPQTVQDEVATTLAGVSQEIEAHLSDDHRGERRRSGIRVALVGAPNAGKSSLLNALSRRNAAIVTPEPGTTRDIIEVALDLGGYPVLLADTAGIRDDPGMIEAEGIRRALAWLETADLVLLLAAPDVLFCDAAIAAEQDVLKIWSKSDMASCPDRDWFSVSSLTGAGIPALLTELVRRIGLRFGDTVQSLPTHERYRAALTDCLAHLNRATAAPLPELLAEDVRLAVRAIGRMTGAVDVESVLDVVFSRFCIGK